MKVKSESEVAQLCPTLSDPMDCSLPGSSVHGIFQARVLERVAIAFSDFPMSQFFASGLVNVDKGLPVSIYPYMGEGNGTPLQYSCLENPMDGGAWKAEVHGVTKSRTRLSNFPFTFHFHALKKEMATHSSDLAWRIPGSGSLVGCRLWGRTESDTTKVT